MRKIGFIGTGNMGYPLLAGAIKLFGKNEVTYSTPFIDEMEKIKEKTGVEFSSDNIELAKSCKFIVICVKPQFIDSVYRDLSKVDLEGRILISIVAGISIEQIQKGVGQNVCVVRAMPNTPAMVGEGMTCVCFSDEGKGFSESEKQEAVSLFAGVGKVEIISEKLMIAAICANGSSPAYVYMFIEALADSAVKYGIPRDTAYRLASQTVLGAAKMVLETGEHPGRLKDNVCSPGGTTIAAVAKLEECGLRNAIMQATDACYAKGVELGKKE